MVVSATQCLAFLLLPFVYCTKYICMLLSIIYSSLELCKFLMKTNETVSKVELIDCLY
jgi:hypothetical protein